MSVETYRRRPDRQPYRHYVQRKLGHIGVVTENLDKSIRNLRAQLQLRDMSYDDVKSALQPHLVHANTALLTTSPLDDTTDPVSWYRLQGRVNFAPELVLAPTAFSTDNTDLRTELADGTSGIATDIVSDAMQLYDSPDTTRMARTRLKGVINEYSYLAVMNYPQDGEVIALPGSQKADLSYQTDSVLYGTTPGGLHYQTSVQIKSSPRGPAPNYDDPAIVVTADDFHNMSRSKDPFTMSEVLINMHEGGQRGHKYNKQRVLLASQAIKNFILSEQNLYNTVYID